MKIAFLTAALLLFSGLNAGFEITAQGENFISVRYTAEDNDRAVTLLLPPGCGYKVETSARERSAVYSEPFYFRDYYMLPLRPFSEDYSLTVRFNAPRLTGRVVLPDVSEMKTLESMVLNKSRLKEYVRPRKANAEKTSYDGTPLAKILIDSTGMYRIFYDEIYSMSGVNLSSYPPSSVKLYNDGIEVPIFLYGDGDGVFGPGDYFEFYGERMHGDSTYYDRYSLKNTYILSAGGGSGIRYVIDNSGMMDDTMIDGEFYSVKHTVHQERDSMYLKIGGKTTVDTTDFWYMNYLMSGDTYDAAVPLDGFDTLTSTVDVRTYFHGTTYLILFNPDHNLEFYYDSALVSSFSWDGLAPYVFEKESLAVTDSDTCRFFFKLLPTDTYPNDVALNWIEVDYSKNLYAEGSKALFTLQNEAGFGDFRFRVKNFPNSSVAIYRRDLKRIENYQAVYDASSGTYEIVFDDPLYSSNRDYAVCGMNSFLACDTVEQFMDAGLADPLNEGEFIIIANQNLKSASEEIVPIFENTHTVKLVGTQEIYDEFSYGKKSAKAIKDFLVTAYNSWTVPPTNVLLLGDGSYDNNNHHNSVPNDIPIAFYYDATGFGMICSDNYYSTVSGDDPIEDISIARFPARNESDIMTAVFKSQKYTDWKNTGIHDLRVIFAYDTTPPGPGMPDYLESKYQSYKLASMLPEYMYPEFMANKYDGNGDFINQLIYGASYMNILAHGAEQSIGSQLYLRLSDVYRIYNMDRMPFINVYSCITAFFDKPNIDSMSIGEAFVYSPYGGAIAYYGSSTASSMSLNHILSESNFKQMTHNGVKNLGEMCLYGELDFYLQQGYIGSYTDDSQYSNQIKNYGLLGINLVDVKIPDLSEKTCSLSSYSISAGETLKVLLSDTQLNDGLMQSVAIDAEDRGVAKDYSILVSGTGENTLSLPDTLVAGSMRVVTMAVTADTAAIYESFPSVLSGGIRKYYVAPSSPDTTDSIYVKVEAAEGGNISNLYAMCKYPNEASYRTIALNQDSSNPLLYSTAMLSPIKAKADDQFFYYYISYSDSLGTASYATPKKSLLIPAVPDIRFASGAYLVPNSLDPLLCVKVQNVGKRGVAGIIVRFYEYVEGSPSLIGEDTIDMAANVTAEARMSISENYYGDDLYVTVNQDSSNASETNYSNNSLSVTEFDQLYSYVGSNAPDTSITFNDLEVSLRTLTSSDTNLIVLRREAFAETISSVDPLVFEGDETPFIYSILPGDTSRMTGLTLGISDYDESGGILQYNVAEEKFCALNRKASSGEASLVNSENRFLFADWSDTLSPVISINIENKEFTGGVVLLNSVDFGCAIEDNEAVNIDKTLIIAGDDTLSSGEYTILNGKDDNSIPIKFSRTFENGTYSVTVESEDIFGNGTSKVLTFIVSNQFKIIRLANFPNPVKGPTTRIVCDFSKVPESSSLRLYSSGGSLIRTVQLSQLDGLRFFCDLDVAGLSNGTYFYTVEGSLDKETVKSNIQKMSVIR